MADVYNKRNYNFELTVNKKNNFIAEWKNVSNKFNKYCLFESPNDNNDNLYLRKYHYQYIETSKNKE